MSKHSPVACYKNIQVFKKMPQPIANVEIKMKSLL
jgi:hypothetical protein